MPHEPIRCFLLHPLRRRREWLMRRSHAGCVCRSRTGEHRAKVRIEDADFPNPPLPKSETPEWTRHRDDPRWPARCDFCEYEFASADE